MVSQKSGDMSMNDILNSIKKFVSSSGAEGREEVESREVEEEQKSTVVHLKPMMEDSAEDPEPTSEREPLQMPEFIRKSLQAQEKSASEEESEAGFEPREEVHEEAVPKMGASPVESYLQQLLGSLKTLSNQQATGKSFDSYIRECLKKSIQQWLDVHLQGIVERVVEQEIKKLIDGVMQKD